MPCRPTSVVAAILRSYDSTAVVNFALRASSCNAICCNDAALPLQRCCTAVAPMEHDLLHRCTYLADDVLRERVRLAAQLRKVLDVPVCHNDGPHRYTTRAHRTCE